MSDQYNPPKRSNVSSWFPLDINMMVSAFMRPLQDRSTKAAAETAVGSMILNTFVEFVIGQGLEAQASPENSILNWDDETRARFISQAESLFRMYAGSRRIDHYGKLNFYQTQKVALRNGLVEGDFLLHRSYRNGYHDYEPYFQLLSGRWVRNPNMETMDTKKLTGGVAFDDAGREVAYWIADTLEYLEDSLMAHKVWKYNPRSNFEEYNLVRFGVREANQVRGIPVLTPVLEDIFELESFKAAYKLKAATQALFTGVITSDPDAPAPAVSTLDTIKSLQVPKNEAAPTEIPNKGSVDDVELGTGNIIQLAPGEKFDMAESKVPATDYSKFVETELSHITAGVGDGGLAYEMVLQKYSNNYSASRATIAGQEKKFRNMRDDLSSGFCTPVWDQVIDWGIRRGYIEAPGYLEGDWQYRQAVLAVTWIGPSPINIDPLKEIQAHILAMDAGVETKEQVCREMFQTDYEETADRIKKEQGMAPPAPTQVRALNIEEEKEE